MGTLLKDATHTLKGPVCTHDFFGAFGWEKAEVETDEDQADVELACVLYASDGRCLSSVYYAQPEEEENCVEYNETEEDESPESLALEGEMRDVQRISFNPNTLNSEVAGILFVALTVSMDLEALHTMKCARFRIVDVNGSGQELFRIKRGADAHGNTLILCSLHRMGGDEWCFRVVDECLAQDRAGDPYEGLERFFLQPIAHANGDPFAQPASTRLSSAEIPRRVSREPAKVMDVPASVSVGLSEPRAAPPAIEPLISRVSAGAPVPRVSASAVAGLVGDDRRDSSELRAVDIEVSCLKAELSSQAKKLEDALKASSGSSEAGGELRALREELGMKDAELKQKANSGGGSTADGQLQVLREELGERDSDLKQTSGGGSGAEGDLRVLREELRARDAQLKEEMQAWEEWEPSDGKIRKEMDVMVTALREELQQKDAKLQESEERMRELQENQAAGGGSEKVENLERQLEQKAGELREAQQKIEEVQATPRPKAKAKGKAKAEADSGSKEKKNTKAEAAIEALEDELDAKEQAFEKQKKELATIRAEMKKKIRLMDEELRECQQCLDEKTEEMDWKLPELENKVWFLEEDLAQRNVWTAEWQEHAEVYEREMESEAKASAAFEKGESEARREADTKSKEAEAKAAELAKLRRELGAAASALAKAPKPAALGSGSLGVKPSGSNTQVSPAAASTAASSGRPAAPKAADASTAPSPDLPAEERAKLVIPEGLRPELQKSLQAVIRRGWSKIKFPHDFTPLHLAARLGSLEAVELLLKARGQMGLSQRDDRGMLPLDYAKHKNFTELLPLLQPPLATAAPAAAGQVGPAAQVTAPAATATSLPASPAPNQVQAVGVASPSVAGTALAASLAKAAVSRSKSPSPADPNFDDGGEAGRTNKVARMGLRPRRDGQR